MVAHACGLRFPHIPYPVCIGRLVECLSGAVQPVKVPEAPLYPRLPSRVGSLPLTAASVGYEARGYSA
jgi:hypothetical protein